MFAKRKYYFETYESNHFLQVLRKTCILSIDCLFEALNTWDHINPITPIFDHITPAATVTTTLWGHLLINNQPHREGLLIDDSIFNKHARPAIVAAVQAAAMTGHILLHESMPPVIIDDPDEEANQLHFNRASFNPLANMILLTTDIAPVLEWIFKHLLKNMKAYLGIEQYTKLLLLTHDLWRNTGVPDEMRAILRTLLNYGKNYLYKVVSDCLDLNLDRRLALKQFWLRLDKEQACAVIEHHTITAYCKPTVPSAVLTLAQDLIEKCCSQAIVGYRHALKANMYFDNPASYSPQDFNSIDTLAQHQAILMANGINLLFRQMKNVFDVQAPNIIKVANPGIVNEEIDNEIHHLWRATMLGYDKEDFNAERIKPGTLEMLKSVLYTFLISKIMDHLPPNAFFDLSTETMYNLIVEHTSLRRAIGTIASLPEPFPVLGDQGSMVKLPLHVIELTTTENPAAQHELECMRNQVITTNVRNASYTYTDLLHWTDPNPESPQIA